MLWRGATIAIVFSSVGRFSGRRQDARCERRSGRWDNRGRRAGGRWLRLRTWRYVAGARGVAFAPGEGAVPSGRSTGASRSTLASSARRAASYCLALAALFLFRIRAKGRVAPESRQSYWHTRSKDFHCSRRGASTSPSSPNELAQ